MSSRRNLSRRHTRALQHRGARPWSDAPHLLPKVMAPVLAAFMGGPQIQSCAHLDGLSDLADLDRTAFWSPAIIRSLVCDECLARLLAELASAREAGTAPDVRCDGCGAVTTDMTPLVTAYDEPDSRLQVIGSCCPTCLTPPEAA